MLNEVDVLVIGGGPSGLTTAAEAARSGASVAVIEKRQVSPTPRAGTLLPRPLELFDSRGIADRFIRRTSQFNPVPFQTSHIWAGMHPVDWTNRDSRFGFTLYLSQHETEDILHKWALECGAVVHHRTELIDLTLEDGKAVSTVLGADGQERTIRSQFVVGADGGKSAVRSFAGIDWDGTDSTFTGVVATAAMEFPWEGALRVGHNERGWATSFRFGNGQTRFTIVHAENRRKLQHEPITTEELEQSIEDIFGERIAITSIVSATRYGDARRWASALVRGPVVLVGEAARLHYPASGVGMNYCIQDAFNVGWKLGAVAAGQAGPSLIQTYESERRPVIEDLLASVDAQVGAQFNLTREGLAFLQFFSGSIIEISEVTARLWDDLLGLRRPYALSEGQSAAVGRPLPDFELILRDGSTRRIYELLRETAFVVVDLTGAQTISPDEVAGLPAAVVAGFPTRRPQAIANATALIVRPDSYVAWTCEEQPTSGQVRNALLDALHHS